MFRRNEDDDEDERTPKRSSGHTWSTRFAWATLFGGAALLFARVSVATVVQIHGEGMAPTFVDGDYVMLLRERWTLQRGDVVVYDPDLAIGAGPPSPDPEHADAPRARDDRGRQLPDPHREPTPDLRNTAVVDREELEKNWEKVQRKSGGIVRYEATPMRLGRIVAVPGDRLTFHVEGAVLGLAVDDQPLTAKRSTVGSAGVAFESTDERRYPVLLGDDDREPWSGLALPGSAGGPVELVAEGYLVLADNRDEGACCDSRALGFIPPEAIRGKVVLRWAGEPDRAAEWGLPRRDLLWRP